MARPTHTPTLAAESQCVDHYTPHFNLAERIQQRVSVFSRGRSRHLAAETEPDSATLDRALPVVAAMTCELWWGWQQPAMSPCGLPTCSYLWHKVERRLPGRRSLDMLCGGPRNLQHRSSNPWLGDLPGSALQNLVLRGNQRICGLQAPAVSDRAVNETGRTNRSVVMKPSVEACSRVLQKSCATASPLIGGRCVLC